MIALFKSPHVQFIFFLLPKLRFAEVLLGVQYKPGFLQRTKKKEKKKKKRIEKPFFWPAVERGSYQCVRDKERAVAIPPERNT